MSRVGQRLLAAPPWGRVSLAEGVAADSAVVVTLVLGRPGADVDGAAGLAERWRGSPQQALLPLVGVESTADSVALHHAAPTGSTLRELLDAHGQLSERQAAALFVDLVAALQRCHRRRLVAGAVHVDNLYVCPPGLDGTAALRLQGAGVALVVAAARGDIGDDVASLYGPSGSVAPELLAGRLPATTSDTWALCAALAHALLGRPAFDVPASTLLDHALRQGPSPDTRAELERRAPALAGAVLQGLSPTPLLRAGALDSLAAAVALVLPEAERLSVEGGEGPWARGTPLMPLAAYAGAMPYGDRFEERVALLPHAVALDEQEDVVDRARLSAALRELEVQRALSRKAQQTHERTGLKLVVVLLTIAVAIAVTWVGTRPPPTPRAEPGSGPARLRLRRAPPPRPVRSIPLFREEDRPKRELARPPRPRSPRP